MIEILSLIAEVLSDYSGEAVMSSLVLATFAYLEYRQKKYWREQADHWQEKAATAEDAHMAEKQRRIEEKEAEVTRANNRIHEKQEEMQARARLVELVEVLVGDEE